MSGNEKIKTFKVLDKLDGTKDGFITRENWFRACGYVPSADIPFE